jgi:hypothetical protein
LSTGWPHPKIHYNLVSVCVMLSGQVSVLWPLGGGKGGGPDVHWFTATPDPTRSAFKAYTFPKVRGP